MKAKGGGWSDNRRQFQRPASIGRWAMSDSGEDELTGFRTFRPHRQERPIPDVQLQHTAHPR